MLGAINIIDWNMQGHSDASLTGGETGVYTAKRFVVGLDLANWDFALQAGVKETDYLVTPDTARKYIAHPEETATTLKATAKRFYGARAGVKSSHLDEDLYGADFGLLYSGLKSVHGLQASPIFVITNHLRWGAQIAVGGAATEGSVEYALQLGGYVCGAHSLDHALQVAGGASICNLVAEKSVQIAGILSEAMSVVSSLQSALFMALCTTVAERSAQVAGLFSFTDGDLVNGLHIALFSKIGKAFGLLGGFKDAAGNLLGLYYRGSGAAS